MTSQPRGDSQPSQAAPSTESPMARSPKNRPSVASAIVVQPRAVAVSWAATAATAVIVSPTPNQPSTKAVVPAGSMPRASIPRAFRVQVSTTRISAARHAAASGAYRPTTPAPISSKRPSSSSVRVCRRTIDTVAIARKIAPIITVLNTAKASSDGGIAIGPYIAVNAGLPATPATSRASFAVSCALYRANVAWAELTTRTTSAAVTEGISTRSVSYTHLTLPTSDLV